MFVDDFDYELPPGQIAQTPLEPRDSSRLLLVNKNSGALEHGHFYDIIDYLGKNDILVFNDTKVIPARLFGSRSTGAKIEVFLLRRLSERDWEVLVRPGRKALPGEVISFGAGVSCKLVDKTEFGGRVASFSYEGIFEEKLLQLGEVPLPPYIHEQLTDVSRYQTVYANHDGSVAAPTAGLHFTEVLLDKIRSKGVQTAFVTLHVGLGTFRPVSADKIEEHKMHSEYYTVDERTAEKINAVKASGGRVIAVGTTAVRVLESVGCDGLMKAVQGDTAIFIYPGYKFGMVDALITNFHLPKSTLLMLVSAFSNRELMLATYKTAIKEGYRFFSFGDAMFIY